MYNIIKAHKTERIKKLMGDFQFFCEKAHVCSKTEL
jgi:hypothetical protein